MIVKEEGTQIFGILERTSLSRILGHFNGVGAGARVICIVNVKSTHWQHLMNARVSKGRFRWFRQQIHQNIMTVRSWFVTQVLREFSRFRLINLQFLMMLVTSLISRPFQRLRPRWRRSKLKTPEKAAPTAWVPPLLHKWLTFTHCFIQNEHQQTKQFSQQFWNYVTF